MEEDIQIVKCVLVGDAAVGKTSLAVAYSTNGYPQTYVPTAYDNYSVIVQVDHRPIRLHLCDTSGQTSFDSLRPLTYADANVFLLVYSTVKPNSLSSIVRNWLPEISRTAPDTPLIVVGTQNDLAVWGRHCVPAEEGRRVANSLGADFFECSALTQQNLKQVFDGAILAALGKKPRKTSATAKFKQRIQERLASLTRKII